MYSIGNASTKERASSSGGAVIMGSGGWNLTQLFAADPP